MELFSANRVKAQEGQNLLETLLKKKKKKKTYQFWWKVCLKYLTSIYSLQAPFTKGPIRLIFLSFRIRKMKSSEASAFIGRNKDNGTQGRRKASWFCKGFIFSTYFTNRSTNVHWLSTTQQCLKYFEELLGDGNEDLIRLSGKRGEKKKKVRTNIPLNMAEDKGTHLETLDYYRGATLRIAT